MRLDLALLVTRVDDANIYSKKSVEQLCKDYRVLLICNQVLRRLQRRRQRQEWIEASLATRKTSTGLSTTHLSISPCTKRKSLPTTTKEG